MSNNSTNEDILKGNGLKPIQSGNNSNGIVVEQRDYKSGITFENFTLNKKDGD